MTIIMVEMKITMTDGGMTIMMMVIENGNEYEYDDALIVRSQTCLKWK